MLSDLSIRIKTMRIADKIQDAELKIIRELYNAWKNKNRDTVNFDADSCGLQSVLSRAGLSTNQARTHLESLQAFDFIEFDENNIKLLPSGIKYARGQFDNIT